MPASNVGTPKKVLPGSNSPSRTPSLRKTRPCNSSAMKIQVVRLEDIPVRPGTPTPHAASFTGADKTRKVEKRPVPVPALSSSVKPTSSLTSHTPDAQVKSQEGDPMIAVSSTCDAGNVKEA